MQGSVWVCGQEDGPSSQTAPAATPNAKAVSPGGQFMGIPLDELMSSLPPKISFTRLPNGLSRRDLFDSRFQILSESDEPQDSALIQGQHSDLQAGIYEGGFKTWECAHDLVEFLERTNQSFDGFKICELGCGSALPSCAALRTRLQSSSTQPTTLVLQDFNKEVLQLVTLPNLILAWHAATDPTPQEEWNISDDLELTEETLQAFTQTLQDTHIDLRFFWGDWAGASISPDTAAHFNPHSIDLMLTSETIYESANLPALIRLLRLLPRWPNCTCLVAAKNVYFGLSGGVHLFKSLVMDDGASTVEEVANILPAVTGGVERVILNVTSV